MDSPSFPSPNPESQIQSLLRQHSSNSRQSPLAPSSSHIQRQTRPKQFGVGGGQVRILGVHSEPGSFAIDESPLTEERPFIGIKEIELESGEVNLQLQEKTAPINSNNRTTRQHKHQRQNSTMSSLYRQVRGSRDSGGDFSA